MFHVPENFRVRKGLSASDQSYGNNGCFVFTAKNRKGVLRTVASDQMGWEHVSVSLGDRCPTWEEMCQVKATFWDEDDCVIQYHPPKSDYVNNHPYCLHLWRSTMIELPRPPSIMVGYAGMNAADAKKLAEGMK